MMRVFSEFGLRLQAAADIVFPLLLLLVDSFLRQLFYFWLSPEPSFQEQPFAVQFPWTPVNILAVIVIVFAVGGNAALLFGQRLGIWLTAAAMFFSSVHIGSVALRAGIELSREWRAREVISPEAGEYLWLYGILLLIQLVRVVYNIYCYLAWKSWRALLDPVKAS